jgi:hypothetical protein
MMPSRRMTPRLLESVVVESAPSDASWTTVRRIEGCRSLSVHSGRDDTHTVERGGHVGHGAIVHYEDGKHVRTTFSEGHASHGQIAYYEDGKHVRTTFSEGHASHGQIAYYEDGKHVRTTWAEGHADHGHIVHCDGDKHVRTTWAEGHASHGQIAYYEDGKHVRTTWAEGHASHGQIAHFEDGKHVRTTWAEGHASHGQIAHFEDGKYVRTTFSEGHADHGHIAHFEDGEHEHEGDLYSDKPAPSRSNATGKKPVRSSEYKSPLQEELEYWTEYMSGDTMRTFKAQLLLITSLAEGVNGGPKSTHANLKDHIDEFEDLFDQARVKFEKKVTRQAWSSFIEFETHARSTYKKLLTKSKQREKEDEAERKRQRENEKRDDEHAEARAAAETARDKSLEAWNRWIKSGHVDDNDLNEATSRPKTVKKNLFKLLVRPEDEELKQELLDASAFRATYVVDRKRQQRQQLVDEREEEHEQVRESIARFTAAVEEGSSSSSTSSPVSTLSRNERKKARARERKADEEAREREIRARQEEEALARAMRESRIEVENEKREREARELRQHTAWQAQAAEEKRHVSTVLISRPPANHWDQHAQQRREAAAAPPAPPAPEPVVAPPTLAALGDASSAPPESTVGNARCIVCMEDDKDQLFMPCKHLLCCHKCANHIMRTSKQCPQCRGAIKQVIGGIYF